MQFLLLLPELPRGRDGVFLGHDVKGEPFGFVRRGRALASSAADALRCRLGIGRRLADPITPPKAWFAKPKGTHPT